MTDRELAADDLPAALAEAATRLAAAPEGTAETWTVPPGLHRVDAGLVVDVAGRDVHLRGAADPAPVLELDGDGAVLTVVGTRVQVSGLRVGARTRGAAVGVAVEATAAAAVTGVTVDGLHGWECVGVRVAAPDAALADVAVTDLTATAGPGTGVRVDGAHVQLAHVEVTGLRATGGAATGVDVTAEGTLAATGLLVGTVRGRSVRGVALRATSAAAELSVLDVRADEITAISADATGTTLQSAGDVDVRGLSVRGVRGTPAVGVHAEAAGELDWLAGQVGDVRGDGAAAAGAWVTATASPHRIAVRDVAVEAVWAPGRAADVVGLRVDGTVPEDAAWLVDPSLAAGGELGGPAVVERCAVRRVSGTGVRVDAELRDVEVRGLELWTTVTPLAVAGEEVLLANLTAHRHHRGVGVGPCALTIVDSLVSGISDGPPLLLDPQTERRAVLATALADPAPPFLPLPDPLPYTDAGPPSPAPSSQLDGALAPAAEVDLRLVTGHPLHRQAVRVPGDPDDVPVFLGAHPPDLDSRCDLRDPDPPDVLPAPAPVPPSPVADYRARDARALLALMRDRAAVVMPEWARGGTANAADQTTMLLELLANRLDRISYEQEVAVAEGYLGTARLRRSVEDHARLVDYRADPGLSATTMLRFAVDGPGRAALGLTGADAALTIGADTVVANPDPADASLVFATEEPLVWRPQLEVLTLAAPVAAGATSALLSGDLTALLADRWLVLAPLGGRDLPAHVVRVTIVERATEVGGATATQIVWDPRRPVPADYGPADVEVYGNVVPGHHGVPLRPAPASDALAELLHPWTDQLVVPVDNRAGDVREIRLPFDRLSRRSIGWPVPAAAPASGELDLTVSVDGDEWARTDDLSLAGPGEACYVLRSGAVLRFGNGVNGAALPRRRLTVAVAVRVGLGAVGNVAAGTLTTLLGLGPGSDLDRVLPPGTADRDELLRAHLRVTNPVAAVGGRDPEPLARIRYRAPLAARTLRSAVVPADYERLLAELPEVAAVRARAVDLGERQVVAVTALLASEDTLTDPDAAAGPEVRDAERLRRWALVRARLEEIRLLGFDVALLPPRFVPLDLDVVVDAHPWAVAEVLRGGVVDALAGDGGLFDPDSTGLGTDVHVDAVHRRVLTVDGAAAARVHRLRRLEPGAPDHAVDGTLAVAADEVAVLRRPYGRGPAGLLTVTVCGGVR
jgi:hypothetical protein